MDTKDVAIIETRISLLNDYRSALKKYFDSDFSDTNRDDVKSFINRNLVAVKNAVIEAGTFRSLTVGPPAMIGGPIQTINPFDNIFIDIIGKRFINSCA